MASHEAIRQLMDLGISQEQAREALARYNNDVAHAADYIFSGAVDTSNEQVANSPSNITTATATTATTTTTAAAVWDDTSVWPPWSTMEMDTQSVDSTRGSAGSTQGGEPLEQEQTEDTGREQQQHLQQQQEWSVVPFRPYSSTSGVEKRGRNGIAWEEPSDPRDRAAVENRPIGLRPPKHKMPFTPAVFQALFHLPCLQQSVMSFHPKKFLWGSPQDYWQGRGEKTSLYSLGSLPASEQQEMGRSRLEAKEMQDPWCTKMNEEESDKASEKDGTEGFELLSLSQSLPEVPEVSTVNMDMNENYSMDLEPIPRCLQAFAEIQKLFAFLLCSQRGYGNVTHVVDALTQHLDTEEWNSADNHLDSFVDLIINCLIDTDQYTTQPMKRFQDLFSIKVMVDYGEEIETEEINCLILGIDQNACNFYECLDPFVFQREEPGDDRSFSSDKTETPHQKITTFNHIPPVLYIALENRMESSREPEDRYSSLYRIDPVIYLDRYLTENKHEVLSAYQQSDQWRKEMNQLQQQQRELKEIVVGETVYETQLLLDHTLKYLETISEQSEACLTTKTVLQTTRESMEQQIQALQEKEQITHQQCSRFLESSEMQKAGYTLHATLHRNEHRDVDETWAYVLVTTEDTTEDTSGNTAGNTAGNTFYPSEPTSCWFRFCDTLVEPVTLDTVLNESCRPHALFYVAQTCPTFSKRECLAAMPKDLKDFIHKDNIIFKEELETTTSWYKTGHGPMTSTLSEDGFSSMEASVDTAVGLTGHCQSSLNAKMELDMIEEHINAIVREAKEAPMSLLLNNVGIFLAHIGNMALLRHLVSFHWKMSSLPFNEKQARQDVSLQWIFSEYDAFVTIAQWVIVAFSWCGKDNTKALKAFVRAKILEENWKTHLLMDVESMDFPHLESLGFNPIVRQFGKALLLELNKAAYKKASEDRDRTKAMKEALWIASQAHKIMRPSKVSEEETCNALVEVWYGLFSSQSTVLLPDQQEILNDVITTYLDGQAGSDFETSEESMEQAGGGENNKMSLGEMYDEGYKIATFLLNIKL